MCHLKHRDEPSKISPSPVSFYHACLDHVGNPAHVGSHPALSRPKSGRAPCHLETPNSFFARFLLEFHIQFLFDILHGTTASCCYL